MSLLLLSGCGASEPQGIYYPSLCRAVINKIHQPEWPGEYKYVTYIELKKGLQEDIISLRYAASEKDLEVQEFIILHKQ